MWKNSSDSTQKNEWGPTAISKALLSLNQLCQWYLQHRFWQMKKYFQFMKKGLRWVTHPGGGELAWPCIQQVLNINFLCYKELKHQLKLKKHHSPYQQSIRCVFQFYKSLKDPRLLNARGLSLYNSFFIPDRTQRETIQVMDRVSLTLFGGALDFKIQLLFKMTLRPDALC